MNYDLCKLNKGYGNLRYDYQYSQSDSYQNDPNLTDPRRGMRSSMNRPPLTGRVSAKQIYDPSVVSSQWPVYKDYSDVNTANILYYTSATSAPYFYPNYDSGTVQKVPFVDPNGVRKDYYAFQDLDESCNKYMSDTMFHREDIQSLQSSGRIKDDYIVFP
jgi:hypothetical protein